MYKERAKLWIAELRSGKYEQGTGVLEINKFYCCLGVACRVAMAQGLDVKITVDDAGVTFFDGRHASWPSSVQEWYGINTVNLAERNGFARRNDSGVTFSAIADIIERELDYGARGDG